MILRRKERDSRYDAQPPPQFPRRDPACSAVRRYPMLADTMRAFPSGVADARTLVEHCVEHHCENRVRLVGSELPVHDRDAAVGAARQRVVVVPKAQLGERFVLIRPPATEPLNEFVGRR